MLQSLHPLQFPTSLSISLWLSKRDRNSEPAELFRNMAFPLPSFVATHPRIRRSDCAEACFPLVSSSGLEIPLGTSLRRTKFAASYGLSCCNPSETKFFLSNEKKNCVAPAQNGISKGFPQCKAYDASVWSGLAALNQYENPVVCQKFPLDDVIEAQQFDRNLLGAIFEVARGMEDVGRGSAGARVLEGYLMATLFYEPSTRTRLSFESAMKRLGGEVLTTENAREFSSAAKGETLEDTIRTVEGYADIIVLRHFLSGSAKQAAAATSIPVINAGDGPGQHPTQALLDVYTIQRELGRLDDIRVGLVGDLANGRTVRSLAYLLSKYDNIKLYFVAPEVVKMKDDIKEYLTSKNVEWEESADLMEVASKCDVVYQTRIQRERFGDRTDLYNEACGKYVVDMKVMNVLQKQAVILHPLPRLDEITLDVDVDPRAAYFRQAKNGLYIRMALLKLLLLGW